MECQKSQKDLNEDNSAQNWASFTAHFFLEA
jgi:hypothetical protein